MLDNGYSLARVETLNWGNFHGYQKFTLRDFNDDGLLFAPPPASAILGVNGSGKSTLIDALMITLLPFENSVKLGVTNDVESGSAGGRTIRDYVLGKFSSTGSSTMNKLEEVYGRKDGCSILLLIFQHNRHRDRMVVAGRIWWYQNFKVNETQLAFIGYHNLGIRDLCPEGQIPRSPKTFRQSVKDNQPHLQIFETMQAYFTALSGSLGQVSRDDLKILNRAFYVKSISQIDQFIRENMLLERENPHLDRLLENVRNGQEIALAIETCEEKVRAIEKVIKDLAKLKDLNRRISDLDQEERLVGLHKDWTEIQDCFLQQKTLQKEIQEAERTLPAAQRHAEAARARHAALHSQLLHDNLEARLRMIDSNLAHLQEKTGWKREARKKVDVKAKRLGLELPREVAEWPGFFAGLGERIEDLNRRLLERNESLEEGRQEKYAIETEARSLRGDIEYLSRFKTLMPRELHAIKEEASRELKIPPGHLCFVGELLQVGPDFQKYRRAIEAVLFPISRNLLCHPDHLNALTKWLDSRGLKSDVTVKRISPDELGVETPELTDPHENQTTNGKSILSMIEMLPAKNHPFSKYLWRWLFDVFDYSVVDVKSFKSTDGHLVTLEGTVKTDRRTMRKLKQNFAFSLGWDNSDVVATLVERLGELNQRFTAVVKRIDIQAQELQLDEEKKGLLHELNEMPGSANDFTDLDADLERMRELESEKDLLVRENPDYHKLKTEVDLWEQKTQALLRELSSLESFVESKKKTLVQVQGLLPQRERDLKDSLPYRSLATQLGGEQELESALAQIDDSLKSRKLSRLQYQGELRQEMEKLSVSKSKVISTVSVNLDNYKKNFADPNLPYALESGIEPDTFLVEWRQAEIRLKQTELPQAQEKWKRFFDQVLMDSVKDTVNEIKAEIFEVEKNIQSINEVLKLTNFEDLPGDKRYLQIDVQASPDERIRKFKKNISEIEGVLGPGIRSQIETQSQNIMSVLLPFVEEFQKEVAYRNFVTDVRNYFQFQVHSLKRIEDGEDQVIETFTGSRRDAKSSAQTTQLAYALLASCLAYRFKFHDPIGGQETPRLLVLDEFGGKFDNEKPREILKLLDKMGFQSVLVSPMSKADLLAEGISHLVLVHKVSASQSKVQSYPLTSKADYDRLIGQAAAAEAAG